MGGGGGGCVECGFRTPGDLLEAKRGQAEHGCALSVKPYLEALQASQGTVAFSCECFQPKRNLGLRPDLTTLPYVLVATCKNRTVEAPPHVGLSKETRSKSRWE